uniref:Glycosyltransferase n=1 Tax=Glycyrrhiza glabra TaxID=49827 RepID=A0AA94YK02_GLYGL|nr:UDP-glycosyltransferase UGT18 [Glycyrrhiza glabra]
MEEEGSNINNNTTTSCPPLKIYFLPFPAPGHMIPMVDLARVFATRSNNNNTHVTLLTTPSNAQPLLQNKQQFHIHTFDFPSNQVGLPPGLENLSSAKNSITAHKVCTAMDLLMSQIESFVKQNPPHALILDFICIRRFSFSDLGIPIIPFNPMPIFATCIFEAINNSHVSLASSDSIITVPGDLPHPMTLHVNPSYGFRALAHPFLQAKHSGRKHGIIVNSFAELEAGYTEYYQKLTGVRVWHLGISSLMVKNEYPLRDNIDECLLSWLSTKEPNSVVYICFGTLCLLRREQCLELARGIEASRKGFLWVVPEDDEEFQVPEGFGDEGMRGKVVRGWVPQVLILNHPAIGAFFTHCGWTSVGEGISAGLPMITMPRFGEQFFNERLVNEVHGLGVEVGAWEWSMSPYDAKNKVVSWERIEKAVRMVMEADSGGTLRKRAKEMKEKACKAVQQGGSSYHNLTSLIQSLKQTSLDGRWLDAN